LVDVGNRTLGLIMAVIGIILILVVFVTAFNAYRAYKAEVDFQQGDLQQALAASAGVLLDLLIRIAFLGVALAAGAVLLGKAVNLLKGCPSDGG